MADILHPPPSLKLVIQGSWTAVISHHNFVGLPKLHNNGEIKYVRKRIILIKSLISSPSAQAPTPPPETHAYSISTTSDFDITRTYHSVTDSDPLISPSIAAIESLIALLSTSPPSTTSETLSLLSSASKNLRSNAPPRDSLAITAGTDLFQRYVINTLQARSSEQWKQDQDKDKDGGTRESDFQAVRAHLLAHSRSFVQRATAASDRIATRARRFIRDGSIVCTCGGSRVVSGVLNAAADDGVSFRVVYVTAESDQRSMDIVTELRAKGVPVAVAPFAALATVVKISSFVMVGAENVVENGGCVSGLGAYQLGLLAKTLGKPFYVTAESYKFVRFYPLGSEDLAGGGPAGALRFEASEGEDTSDGGKEDGRESKRLWEDEVDLTPPELVTALITEEGVHSPSAVSEELIKMWY